MQLIHGRIWYLFDIFSVSLTAISLFIDQDEPDEEEAALRVTGKTPEKASAFIQEVADRKPKGTTILRSPLKQGWNTVISIFGAFYFD